MSESVCVCVCVPVYDNQIESVTHKHTYSYAASIMTLSIHIGPLINRRTEAVLHSSLFKRVCICVKHILSDSHTQVQ